MHNSLEIGFQMVRYLGSLLLTMLTALLTACSSTPEERAASIRNSEQQEQRQLLAILRICDGRGLKEGTPQHLSCVYDVGTQLFSGRQSTQFQAPPPQNCFGYCGQTENPLFKTPKTTRCHRNGDYITCTTD